MVAMRRHAEGLLEGACEMKQAQVYEFRESGQRNVFGEMLFDEFHHAFPLPRRQATTKRLHGFGCRAFQSAKFMHQYEAQGLCVLTAPWVGIADFGLQFEGSVPHRLIEEEQARADSGSDSRVWVEQRVLEIDIEIGDARQHARPLPPVEPMAGRHKTELAIEFA